MKRAKSVAKVNSQQALLKALMLDLDLVLKQSVKLKFQKAKQSSWAGLSLINRVESKRLNQLYLKRAYPTDVLSFPSDPKFQTIMNGYMGELLICRAIAKRQAKESTHSEIDEMRVLIVHGVLHLLGFDHEKSKQGAKAMCLAEGRLMKALKWAGKTESLIARSTSIKTK